MYFRNPVLNVALLKHILPLYTLFYVLCNVTYVTIIFTLYYVCFSDFFVEYVQQVSPGL